MAKKTRESEILPTKVFLIKTNFGQQNKRGLLFRQDKNYNFPNKAAFCQKKARDNINLHQHMKVKTRDNNFFK